MVEAQPQTQSKLKDAQGHYFDAEAYATKIKEQRKISEQQRTEAALSKLDFLESLHQEALVEDENDVVVGVVSDEEVEVANVSKPKRSKKKSEEEEEPKYAHSLEDLMVIEEDE